MPEFSRHLSYANVTATLALVLAVGGGGVAYAVASKNSVNSAAIINGQVKRPDLAGSAVNGAKVADNSLTGADINEGSLATVPSAATAGSADNVLRAMVTADGDLIGAQSSGAVSAASYNTGRYEVIFDRDVSDCTWLVGTAVSGQVPSPAYGFASVTGREQEVAGIFVQTLDATGTNVDRAFSAVVVC